MPTEEETQVGTDLVLALQKPAYELVRQDMAVQQHLISLTQNINIVHLELPKTIVAFCVTTYKRSWQLKLSLPWNLLTLYPYRHRAHLFIADLNEEGDSELEDFFAANCGLAQKIGLLTIFRGTIPGWDASRCKNAVHYAALHKLEQVSTKTTNTVAASNATLA